MTLSQTNHDQLLADPDDLGPIVRIAEDRRHEAIVRLVAVGSEGDAAHADRFLRHAAGHAIDLGNLFARLDDAGRVCATTLAVASPGRTAMFFTSHPTHRDQLPRVAGLIAHAARSLQEQEIELAQVLLEPTEQLDAETYGLGGFGPLATLQYLQRVVPRTVRGAGAFPPGVTVETYRRERRDELLAVLEASYEQTLDCPGLFGLRRTEDILEGHQATGHFDPALWTLLRIDGVAHGALLMSRSIGRPTVELVYLGLSPAARGTGLGAHLLRYGLGRLAGGRDRTITLAVDESNAPAMSLYRREGFRPVVRRLAMIRSLRPSS